jgi:hypothetical protein
MIDMALVQTVHTSGINWSSVGTLAGTMLGSVGAAGKWIISRAAAGRKVEREVAAATMKATVGDLGKSVSVQLDQVGKHLARQDRAQDKMDASLRDVRERTMKIEGKLSRTW